jgi:thiamine biosynthesis lipoprotein
MGTFVTIRVVGLGTDHAPAPDDDDTIARAFEWFRRVEACCTRFDPASEAMQLTSRIGMAVPASAILYEAVQFALAVAEASGGAFDPTVGSAMESRGFNRNYRTGHVVRTALDPARPVSYRDVLLDPDRRSVTLLCPLILDLGAVAKGLAIDMAARELQPFENFAVDAGGDLYVGGRNEAGEPWSIGIRHPRRENELIDSVQVSNGAVCTSGDYERTSADEGHHLLDPRAGASPRAVASATVIAPTAMAADALATAAFVLGPVDGIRLLEGQGVNGLIVTPSLDRFITRGFHSDSILPDSEGIADDRPRPADGAGLAGGRHHAGRAGPR